MEGIKTKPGKRHTCKRLDAGKFYKIEQYLVPGINERTLKSVGQRNDVLNQTGSSTSCKYSLKSLKVPELIQQQNMACASSRLTTVLVSGDDVLCPLRLAGPESAISTVKYMSSELKLATGLAYCDSTLSAHLQIIVTIHTVQTSLMSIVHWLLLATRQ